MKVPILSSLKGRIEKCVQKILRRNVSVQVDLHTEPPRGDWVSSIASRDCANCVHLRIKNIYSTKKTAIKYGLCMKSEISEFTQTHKYASIMRAGGRQCGPDGKLFEEKPRAEPVVGKYDFFLNPPPLYNWAK